ncbi:transporter substrate-binding domain-containing protein [Marinomonas rhodophyticola]|uniref:Transporter substrate-binding domain-containing protein n=1 Tax=Marinomonas rhodophyticola TaxID=2992803 RepID=A0ABT3KKZ2_9GAMM|nr:transporter substrate-binding domain-containing protein [Marinomonas sp. KJ51-3]MCW4631236.1 transporter substrate-binding domain-containing protein [Marinomonas sp. KJ51-3]
MLGTPFNFIDEAGKPQGFDVDIARALCAKMAADCEILTQDWDGLIPGLKVRKFDAIIASMSITEDRLKVVDFTNKYYSGGLRFMGRVGDNFDLNNLSGKTIGAQRATLGAQYLEDNFTGKADLKFYDNQDNVYLDLVAGRLDIVLSDELPTYNWLKTSESGAKFEFKGDAFMKTDNIGIAVRKGDDKLKEKLNKALDQILADGTYQKINAKYFPFSIY